MTTNQPKNKGTRATRAGQLIAGARKRLTNGSQVLTFAGALANVTVDAAVAELQELVDNRAATTAARATARDKVETEAAAMPGLVAFMNAFETLIRVMFSNDTAALADFGLQQRKQPAPQTAEQKAVAAAKRAATREARGTKGPKAKQAVKGNVTAQVVVTPMTAMPAAAPAAPPPAPAPAATPGGAAVTQPKS
ncbi:MAG TPA: hypothetical protein VIY73_17745 [Polyangiaceae bacterium]